MVLFLPFEFYFSIVYTCCAKLSLHLQEFLMWISIWNPKRQDTDFKNTDMEILTVKRRLWRSHKIFPIMEMVIFYLAKLQDK